MSRERINDFLLVGFALALVAFGLSWTLNRAGSRPEPRTEEADSLATTVAPVAMPTPSATGSAEAVKLITTFEIDEAFEVSLVASEPMVQNPVCFWPHVDGSFFVCETFRQEYDGVPDNRNYKYWQDDDMALQSVPDRRAMYLKHHPEYAEKWTREEERIRVLEDADGDGKAESVRIFADGFRDILDGTGAGVLVRGNDVWYTCIPNLWHLRDDDGDGRAEHRKSLHGAVYGVRVALRGHDMHGLTFGPDGKLYYSIGDRGYNIRTPDGRHLVDPGRGAIFRCEPDGSQLEVYATGVRNPQELAFDDYGNLVTGDNNGDGGDQARICYLVEGGETGWRMNFQYLPKRGPWTDEGWWRPRHEGQAAFLIPPVANLTSGPSGLTYATGVGMPERYDGAFFLCDFRGAPSHSGVWSFKLAPHGAGFKLEDAHWLIKRVLATDVDFAPDGSLVVSDWVDGWVGVDKGRLYRIRHPEALAADSIHRSADILAEGFDHRDPQELRGLLVHPDRRVRQGSQFALAARGAESVAVFSDAAKRSGFRLTRLHGIWGLGQVAARAPLAVDELVGLLGDDDGEVRAQTAKVLGDLRHPPVFDRFLSMLGDDYPRARYFAAMGLAKLADRRALEPLRRFLEINDDEDLYLRHAGVMGLAGIQDADAVHAMRTDPSRAVRMAVTLVLRRLRDPRVADLLTDVDPLIGTEAARAIYDLPINDAMPALAGMLGRRELRGSPTPYVKRAIGANDLLSGAGNADALANYAADVSAPGEMREMALKILLDWPTSPLRDPVMNDHRPRPPRQRQTVTRALTPRLAGLLDSSRDGVRRLAARLAGASRAKSVAGPLFRLLSDVRALPPTRVEALEALFAIDYVEIGRAVRVALESGKQRLEARGIAIAARVNPATALPILAEAVAGDRILVRQLSYATLATLNREDSDAILERELAGFLAGRAPKEVTLDLLEASRKRRSSSPGLNAKLTQYESARPTDDPLAAHLPSLWGGNADKGRRIFRDKTETTCLRCHSYEGRESDLAGPELSDVGLRLKRAEILESIVTPNLKIADGFQNEFIETIDGHSYTGRVLSEADGKTEIEFEEDGARKSVQIASSTIVFRKETKSSMPADLIGHLSPYELRDLIEFLSSLRKKVGKSAAGH